MHRLKAGLPRGAKLVPLAGAILLPGGRLQPAQKTTGTNTKRLPPAPPPVALPLAFSLPLVAAAETWRAGAAKTIITPDKPMWMAGYGSRDHAATGKSIDLWGKVLVLEDPQGTKAVLITLDLVGIDREFAFAL